MADVFEQTLPRIADALERIANQLEKAPEKATPVDPALFKKLIDEMKRATS